MLLANLTHEGPVMPRFQAISQFFTGDDSGPYLGQAIASEEAIYPVTALEPLNLTSLFTGRIMQKLAGDSGPFQTRLSDLPNSVTRDSTWLVKTGNGFVRVLHRYPRFDVLCRERFESKTKIRPQY